VTKGERPLVGAVEGGGTKFVCAVGRGPHDIREETRFHTEEPGDTLARVLAFFSDYSIEALGVGMFGPLDLARGTTLRTPKPGWDHVPVREQLQKGLDGIPIGFDTDVNAAALGEQRYGAAQGADPCLYVTVGTGVGGGVVIGGRPLHGLMHPELGHVTVPVLSLADGAPDPFPGACPFHGRCLEGLVSGPAIAARVGRPATELDDDDPVWDLVGRYLGAGLAPAVLLLSPRRVVIGGGVGKRPGLLATVRSSLKSTLAGYVQRDALGPRIDEYVVAPGLGDRAGIAGAFALADAARQAVVDAAPSV
jgi:fructokinase